MKAPLAAALTLLTLAGAVALVLSVLPRVFAPGCGGVVRQSVTSPDGRLRAIEFETNCGPDHSSDSPRDQTSVAIVASSAEVAPTFAGDQPPWRDGTVFFADSGSSPDPSPRLDWLGPRKLRIRLPRNVHNAVREDAITIDGQTIAIRYVVSP